MEMGAGRVLKKNNTATQFSVRNITPDIPLRTLTCRPVGVLFTWASDKKAGERQATYVIGFKT